MNSRWIILNGLSPYHIQKSQILAFYHDTTEQATRVILNNTSFWVRETPEQIMELLRVRRS